MFLVAGIVVVDKTWEEKVGLHSKIKHKSEPKRRSQPYQETSHFDIPQRRGEKITINEQKKTKMKKRSRPWGGRTHEKDGTLLLPTAFRCSEEDGCFAAVDEVDVVTEEGALLDRVVDVSAQLEDCPGGTPFIC